MKCIALGKNAKATRDYEFALSVDLGYGNGMTEFKTILTPMEFDVMKGILERMLTENLIKQLDN